ncbi:hypothetical protein BGX24_001626 [Mortierella sp. AD032]|nr:hypothetical protein BGX24_001626 [Mortierella sp. AD032]
MVLPQDVVDRLRAAFPLPSQQGVPVFSSNPFGFPLPSPSASRLGDPIAPLVFRTPVSATTSILNHPLQSLYVFRHYSAPQQRPTAYQLAVGFGGMPLGSHNQGIPTNTTTIVAGANTSADAANGFGCLDSDEVASHYRAQVKMLQDKKDRMESSLRGMPNYEEVMEANDLEIEEAYDTLWNHLFDRHNILRP